VLVVGRGPKQEEATERFKEVPSDDHPRGTCVNDSQDVLDDDDEAMMCAFAPRWNV
jgi:hypothetical protein